MVCGNNLIVALTGESKKVKWWMIIMKIQNMQSEESRNLSGVNIRKIREDSGMTQNDLVSKLKKNGMEITACTLCKMETGKRSITDIELVIIAKTLSVSVESLIQI